MKINEILKILIKDYEIPYKTIAEECYSNDDVNISKKLSSNNMTIGTILPLADCLGYELMLKPKGNNNQLYNIPIDNGENRDYFIYRKRTIADNNTRIRKMFYMGKEWLCLNDLCMYFGTQTNQITKDKETVIYRGENGLLQAWYLISYKIFFELGYKVWNKDKLNDLMSNDDNFVKVDISAYDPPLKKEVIKQPLTKGGKIKLSPPKE